MKNTLLIFLISLSTSIYGQSQSNVPDIHVRVFNLEGKKIGSGKISSMTDSTLVLSRRDNAVRIYCSVSQIGKVKTKHSAINIISGTAISAGIITYTAVEVTTQAWSVEAGVGAFIGGTVIGSIIALIHHPRTYHIEGDVHKWIEFEQAIRQ